MIWCVYVQDMSNLLPLSLIKAEEHSSLRCQINYIPSRISILLNMVRAVNKNNNNKEGKNIPFLVYVPFFFSISFDLIYCFFCFFFTSYNVPTAESEETRGIVIVSYKLNIKIDNNDDDGIVRQPSQSSSPSMSGRISFDRERHHFVPL